jgi:hypothetical protein
VSTIKRIVEFIDRHDGLVTALTTIALVLATVALVCVTSQLATSTKELRNFAEKQDEKLANANNLSHESYALTQRPFITIKNVEARYDDIRSYWLFQVIAENSGNTPTRAMHSFATYTENADRDPEEVFQSPEADGRRFPGIIGPKAPSSLAGSFVAGIPATYVADLATRRKDFYIYGVVHYRDWFSDTSEHI